MKVTIAALILAAGQANRYRAAGGEEPTKLVANYHGQPLIRHVAQAALASHARPVVVVTGHEAQSVKVSLNGLEVTFVHNNSYESGMASSLQAGLASLPEGVTGVLVLLGDMPLVTPALMDLLCEKFGQTEGIEAVVPLVNGQRGNPVLLSRSLFPQLTALEGDQGARKILDGLGDALLGVAMDDCASLLDVDTPQALDRLE